ncbi:hypothetical protein PGT21_020881 [Puccinia graminis f. sp. tritici]|uniref:Centrosomin N-terminal motif 1 domain-containing protein n=1 Tax=Puccinia graminis f. sp. tritici TaxID=56615 RepID=A0A5B0MG43_PUCGR|nr:hypothetical protein PGT21_020881 [Puccinia graminis f. sp. tritici]
MNHPDHSIGEGTTAGPDKTSGDVSRLAGLTFGTDEDSFHSQDFKQKQKQQQQQQQQTGGANHLTLREQEKVIDEVKKENFNLKLKIYFLEDRLAKLAPDQVDLALKENVEIKVEFQTVRQELKRYKRLLLEAERAIELAKTERDQLLEQKSLSEERTSSGLQAEMRKARDQLAIKDKSIQSLESELQRLKDRLERFSSKDNLSKIVSSHASRNHTRHSLSNQSVDEWSNQEQMMEIKNLRNELTEERQLKEDLLGDNQDLRHRLIETKNALQDTQDEIQRISRVEEHGYRSHQISRAQSRFEEDPDDYLSSGRKSTLTSISTGGVSNQKIIKEFKREIQDLERQLRELENENIELRSQVNAQVKMLSTKNSEKDKLQDQVINLKRKVLDLQDELDQDAREFQKIQQAGHTSLHDQTADEVREELNMYRDKSASAMLTLEKREKEVDELNAELDDRDAIFNDEVQKITRQYNSELDAIKAERDEFQQVLDEREDQIAELSDQLREVINLQEETDKSLRETRSKLKEKDKDYNLVLQDLEAAQTDLKEIGAGNRELAADVNEKEQQINELNAELDELEQEASNRATVHEQVVAKLKQKLNHTKSELTELSIQHESSLSELKFLQDKHEELQLRQAELEERRKKECDLKRRLERELDDLERELRGTREEMDLQIIASKKEKRELHASFQLALDTKQKALSQAESDIASLKGKLEIREEDIEKLENMLKRLENESNQINQSQSHDKFSLELEIERIQRDLLNSTQESQSFKDENESLKNQISKFQATISSLNSEKDELFDKLQGVQRARDSLNEKYEEQTKNLRETQNDLSVTKNRLQSLEDELASDHLQLNKFEHQYKDQISERNTLLLTIYQYIDKLLSSGSTHRRISSAHDVKPFTNFTVFHESIINRLKSLGAMQSGFDTKIKEVEKKLEKQYTALKRQHDSRMRQLDQFETTMKAATDTQRQWRARLTTKQGEVEAARETCNELQKQISSLKTRASIAGTSPGSITEPRQASTKLANLEKKLAATQSQLKSTEEKFNEAKLKVSAVESSWQARLKELQDRNKELEEKVKREKKSAVERKSHLDHQLSDLKDQIVASDHRSKQLEELLISHQQNIHPHE